MKIKRIEIIGFKSFVDKVSLDFQEGITAILGPNGCGKSNLIDAIRWAMGEQNAKNLRGRSMEDVIFGGSESRKPLGMAEVSILFENEDGLAPAIFRDMPEIVVTRRLHRSGESEYFLNKTPCRLLDITELFMDTGVGARAYSVIEQGKIGMILSAKAEDRRFLIEEAAGVTKFKSRKKSALRKIEATRQNLLRLGDIVAEVRRQLGSLKRQAQKAQRFRELREELRDIEIRFARKKFRTLMAEGEVLDRQEAERRQVLEGLSARLAEGELRQEEMRLRQAEREKEVAQDQERIFHLTAEIQRIEGRLEFGGRELEGLDRQRERLAAERVEVTSRLGEVEREEEALEQSHSQLGAEIEKEMRALAEGEAGLEECAAREQELATRLEDARSALYALLTDLSRLGSRQEEVQRHLQAQADRVARNRAEAVTVREQMEEIRQLLDALETSLRGFMERHADLQQEREFGQEKLQLLRRDLEETESALLTLREGVSQDRSRLESLNQIERTLEGYGGGVRALLGEAAFRQRFGGLVADFLNVPPHLEVAVEAVLGDRLQALPAEPDDLGPAFEFLRRHESRCTFLLPRFDVPELPTPGGRALLSLVQAKGGKEEVVRALLTGVFLVDSLQPYLGGGLPAGAVLVTEEGEVLTSRGEVTGGGLQALDQGLLHRKREMKELAARVEASSRQLTEKQAHREKIRGEIVTAEEYLRETEAALHRKELKVVDSEKDRDRLRHDAERLQDRLEVLNLEEDQLHAEGEELDRQLRSAAEGREDRERQRGELETAAARLQEEMQVLRRETEVVRERVTALKVKVASIRERGEGSRRSLQRLAHLRQELQGRLAQTAAREAEGEDQQARLRTEGEGLRVELEVLFRRREEEKVRADRRRDDFETAGRQAEEQETALREVRSGLARIREELAELQLKGRENALEADHLREAIRERYRLELTEAAQEEEGVFDPVRAERRQVELRGLIEEIGEVNLTAIDEYREMEERHRFLAVQQEDLKRSLEGLQTAIAKINRTTRRRFRETFDLVNAKFQETFPRLFRGGQAELRLTDEEDLLETGIDIVVQPPGKRLQSVNLLSGGEKALTAVALIFSIFLIKPSPFCILDEVDAPLDDANIGRFNDLVREMAGNSQFILITHNRRTMEVADLLYGVTMEEPGISKVVSVRMKEFAA